MPRTAAMLFALALAAPEARAGLVLNMTTVANSASGGSPLPVPAGGFTDPITFVTSFNVSYVGSDLGVRALTTATFDVFELDGIGPDDLAGP